MGMQLDIWKSQNHYFAIMERFRKGERNFPDPSWKAAFLELGKLLQIEVDSLETVPL